MSDELKKLADARNDLLLAEAAAWLHDMGKCADEHIIHQASDMPSGHKYTYKTAQSHRVPSSLPPITLHGERVPIKELIEKGMPRVINDNSQPWILRVLGRCHSVAHVEKELNDRDISTKQPQALTRPSSAFGLEGIPVSRLTVRLDALPFTSLSDRPSFVSRVQDAFGRALGDTRRPVNEVTLSDWSSSVAALYKAALAGPFFGLQPAPDDLRWRVLRVNFDVMGLYAKAIKIADLLGYEERIKQACEKVKRLIEEEYPLGNEIYRDTTGIYFTFPDWEPPADLKDEIQRNVEKIEPELAPRIAVEVPPGATASVQLKKLLADARKVARKDLAQPFDLQNLNSCWQFSWDSLPSGKWELCPVCRLRPMEEHAEACETCIGRRRLRIEAWSRKPSQTIWMDEIADHNGRVAIILGKFGLDDWLSGDLVQTMLVKAVENEPAACVPKNPSSARLRRVWETCRRFWTETVEGDFLAKYPYGACSKNPVLRIVRLAIQPKEKNGWHKNVAYDLTLNGQPVSLLWDDSKGYFVTIINLQLSAGDAKSIEQLRHALPGCVVEGPDPINPRKLRRFTIQQVVQAQGDFSSYRPFLTLHTSPDQFLSLVPAGDALDIACKIRCEYQKQFGKVQNRLPLFLGLVFSLRKAPLMAVMDTARRMLAIPLDSEQWTVKGVDNEKLSAEGWPDTVKVSLERNGQQICFKIKTVMGDDTTKDVWYPYFFLEGDPGTRSLRFQPDGCWLVHVNDLHAGDPVGVTPSRFACLFLESTAQRFRFDPVSGTMLLDELPRLMEMWKQVCASPDMSDTKLQAIHALFERKRLEWKLGGPTLTQPIIDDTFRNLVETTLTHQKVQGVKPEDVLNGRFSRCLDLHLHILKRRVSDEWKNKEARNEPGTL